ncbi:MAG: WYL domain-containing protein [Smithellaceae bacterium]|nr:WYL domain-containing protein [Smithellaceae bacterium]
MGEFTLMERFFWLDASVRQNKFPNATTYSRKFECSTKTAQRAIEFFRCRLHAPLEYDASRKGYYYEDPSYQFPLMHLNEKELLSLLISKKLLTDAASGPLGEDLGQIAEKIGSLLAQGLPDKVNPDKMFSFRASEFSPANPALFSCVSNALLASRLLAFRYYSPASNASTTRMAEPHHLVNYMGNWHLIAFCRVRQDWRDFLLSRLSDCTVSEGNFTPRPESAWKPFLTDTFGIFQNRECFPVTIKFSPVRSRWIRGQIWHPDQRTEELLGGALRLTIPVSHEAEIMMEILKHGAHVEVLEPKWLRDKVKKEINKMTKKYCL